MHYALGSDLFFNNNNPTMQKICVYMKTKFMCNLPIMISFGVQMIDIIRFFDDASFLHLNNKVIR